MSETTIIAIIALVVSVSNVGMAFIAAMVSWKTHVAVNSRMDKFMKIAEEVFMLKGEQKGLSDERARHEKKDII